MREGYFSDWLVKDFPKEWLKRNPGELIKDVYQNKRIIRMELPHVTIKFRVLCEVQCVASIEVETYGNRFSSKRIKNLIESLHVPFMVVGDDGILNYSSIPYKEYLAALRAKRVALIWSNNGFMVSEDPFGVIAYWEKNEYGFTFGKGKVLHDRFEKRWSVEENKWISDYVKRSFRSPEEFEFTLDCWLNYRRLAKEMQSRMVKSLNMLKEHRFYIEQDMIMATGVGGFEVNGNGISDQQNLLITSYITGVGKEVFMLKVENPKEKDLVWESLEGHVLTFRKKLKNAYRYRKRLT